MERFLFVLLVAFSVVVAGQEIDNVEKKKCNETNNEIWLRCANCASTCQTIVNATVDPVAGCACRNGFVMDEVTKYCMTLEESVERCNNSESNDIGVLFNSLHNTSTVATTEISATIRVDEGNNGTSFNVNTSNDATNSTKGENLESTTTATNATEGVSNSTNNETTSEPANTNGVSNSTNNETTLEPANTNGVSNSSTETATGNTTTENGIFNTTIQETTVNTANSTDASNSTNTPAIENSTDGNDISNTTESSVMHDETNSTATETGDINNTTESKMMATTEPIMKTTENSNSTGSGKDKNNQEEDEENDDTTESDDEEGDDSDSDDTTESEIPPIRANPNKQYPAPKQAGIPPIRTNLNKLNLAPKQAETVKNIRHINETKNAGDVNKDMDKSRVNAEGNNEMKNMGFKRNEKTDAISSRNRDGKMKTLDNKNEQRQQGETNGDENENANEDNNITEDDNENTDEYSDDEESSTPSRSKRSAKEKSSKRRHRRAKQRNSLRTIKFLQSKIEDVKETLKAAQKKIFKRLSPSKPVDLSEGLRFKVNGETQEVKSRSRNYRDSDLNNGFLVNVNGELSEV